MFGFTTGSDVSDVGAWGASATYAGAFKGGGFKPGSFAAHTGQLQVATAFLNCWEIGPYLIGSTARGDTRGVLGRVSLDTYGGGIEQKYKIFGRATHGFGLTLDWDINYQGFKQKDTTLAPILSFNGDQVTNSFRIFIDREIITGKLYGAVNIVWDQIWFDRPGILAPGNRSDYLRSSNLTLSGALSYQAVDGFFVGGEARYVRTHLGNFFNTYTGDALYVGPTFFWQATKSLAISGAWGVQVPAHQQHHWRRGGAGYPHLEQPEPADAEPAHCPRQGGLQLLRQVQPRSAMEGDRRSRAAPGLGEGCGARCCDPRALRGTANHSAHAPASPALIE